MFGTARTLFSALALGLALTLASGTSAAAPPVAKAPPKIKVKIDSTPAGASVFVGSKAGESLGKTPLKSVALVKGATTLVFTLEGWADAEVAVDVKKAGQAISAKLEQLAKVELTSASNLSAESATVAIDGVALGKIPFSRWIKPGRHELRITKPKFQDYAQWFEIKAGETRAQVITLEAVRVAGSLLVAGDVPGADVLVDGVARGVTPLVVDNLDPGVHTVEIRAKELPAWAQTITVKGGERTTVSPTIRPQKAASGSLRVLSNVEGAQVLLDGEVMGKVPADAAEVAPGTHILEVIAPKYQSKAQEVVIEAGQKRVVRVELALIPETAPVGTLRVTSVVPGSTIYVDGAAVGGSPFERADLSIGEHFVTVEAKGYKKWQSSAKIEAGKRVELVADLRPIAALSVRSEVSGAVVKLDGSVIGKTPSVESGEIGAGAHELVVTADGYATYAEKLVLQPGELRKIDVKLEKLPPGMAGMTPGSGTVSASTKTGAGAAGQTAAQGTAGAAQGAAGASGTAGAAQGTAGAAGTAGTQGTAGTAGAGGAAAQSTAQSTSTTMTSTKTPAIVVPPANANLKIMQTTWGAGTLPQGKVTLDAGLGWPYFVDLRLGVGVVDHFDAGVGVRTTFESFEFVGRVKAATRLNVLGLGVFAEGGGGLGLDERNVYFAAGGPMATLFFADRAAFTLRMPFEYYDEMCLPDVPEMPVNGSEVLSACDGRQKAGRISLGGILEIAASERINYFGVFEGVIVGDARNAYQDVLFLENRDRLLYFKVGITLKL